jgi:antitoxin MazE
MRVKIAKWGNSLAVRLPRQYAQELGLAAGSEIELEKNGDQLVLDAGPKRKIPVYKLEDLLAQIKPGTEPPPFEDWSAAEAPWPDDDWSDIAPTDEEMGGDAAERRKRT